MLSYLELFVFLHKINIVLIFSDIYEFFFLKTFFVYTEHLSKERVQLFELQFLPGQRVK